ncbi:VOC family protein [Propionibacteriaceae bacterium Y2011]
MPLSIASITVDCDDAARLAVFWGEVLHQPVDPGASREFATIGNSAEPRMSPGMMFLRVPDERPAKNSIHLDLATADYAAELERLVAAGATKVTARDEYGIVWTTLADPEGNLFDVADESGEH